jgi:glutathione peroxidase
MPLAIDDLIPVRVFVNGIEAELARTALEAAGIHAVIRRDDCGGVRPSLWLAGIPLLVPRADLEAAHVVLSTPALYAAPEADAPPARAPSIYDMSAVALDGRTVSLECFRGQVLLIVNVASRCGYTGQYAGLEALYRAYRHRGFSVLGFPCNQFGRQEPGSSADIRTFCAERFDVTFPMFARVDVNGARAHPLFRLLKSQRSGWFGRAIKWNFTKFLVDRDGQVLGRYGSADVPQTIASAIEAALGTETTAAAALHER